jgi:hypothetical protein
MASSRIPGLAREGRLPHPDRLATSGARVLDPGNAPVADGKTGNPTAYVAHRLMIAKDDHYRARLRLLQQVAEQHHWRVEPQEQPDKARRLPLGVRTVTISATSSPHQPDAWHLLQFVRQEHGADALRGIDLDHIVDTGAFEPQHWEIPHPQHWEIPHPDGASAASAALMSYGVPGSGGRQPIAYAGPRPARGTPRSRGRRPVVAILDTGCYAEHPWFAPDVVKTDQRLGRFHIGYTGKDTDPEYHGDLLGPLDGSIDRIAGHGTFIAGLVHQGCPDAQILSWRGIETTRALVESEWLTTLAQITELVRLNREHKNKGHAIDVLSISMGYYHENTDDDLLDPILWTILDELGRLGVTVVCSAGNDATDRPCYPAAFAPWRDHEGPVKVDADRVPVVSAGALNPNSSDALFTNAGAWVRAYSSGAAVMSTMPPFDGGLQPIGKVTIDGRLRESIDPDDYRSDVRDGHAPGGGFGLWSGTSFAAPLIAGRIAAAMGEDLMAGRDREHSAKAAVRRGWDAVEAATGIRRSE